MNFELEQLLQQRNSNSNNPNQQNPHHHHPHHHSLINNNGHHGTTSTKHPKLTRDNAIVNHSHYDRNDGSSEILDHLIAIILQENASYLEKLLQNEEVLDVLDMQDGKGFTPLHISSDKHDVECVRLLLQAGANPNISDHFGRNALHWVVSGGCHCESCNTKRGHCTKLLIQARINIEAEDHNGETPLFYAANNMLTNSSIILLENGAEISKTNLKGVNLGQLLVQKIPFVMTQLLDSCIAYDEEDNSELKIDFSVFLDSSIVLKSSTSSSIPPPKNVIVETEGGFDATMSRSKSPHHHNSNKTVNNNHHHSKNQSETELLSCMLKAFPIGRELLLTHPVTQTFLHLKWKYVRKWFWFIRIFYCLLTLLYSYFIYDFYINTCPYHGNNDNDDSSEYNMRNLSVKNLISRPLYPCQTSPLNLPMHIYIIIGCIKLGLICMLLNQLNSICTDAAVYFKNWILALGWWILIISSSLSILPPIGILALNYWIYPLAAFSLFWNWAMHLAQLNRIPYLGTYVEMLGKALHKMFIIGCIYSSLFIAFVLGFCVLFPQNSMFEQIPSAIVKTFLMMVGDRAYENIFEQNNEERLLHIDYNIPTHLFYIAFIIIFGILIINLLVGLAVSDIQELRKNAELLQVERQIVEMARLERFFRKSWFCISSCTRKAFLSIMSVEARNGRYFNFSPIDPHDTSLPYKLKAKFIPYLPTRSCLKKINITAAKARVLQKHSSSFEPLRTEQTYNPSQQQQQRPFYANDNLDSIINDLKLRLEGLNRRTNSASGLSQSFIYSSGSGGGQQR